MLSLLPNFITSLRLIASPVLMWLIVSGRFGWALLLVAFAGVTDFLDGFTARRLRVRAPSGIWFDPLADKVMLVAAFIGLAWAGIAPLWLFALVIGRDVVIVCGALLVRIFRGVRQFPPSTLGKVSTFFQITYALVALLVHATDPDTSISRVLYVLALLLVTLFTVWSGVDYIRIGLKFVFIDASMRGE